MANPRTNFLKGTNFLKACQHMIRDPKSSQVRLQDFHGQHSSSLHWHVISHASLSVVALIQGQKRHAVKEIYLMTAAVPVYFRDQIKNKTQKTNVSVRN